MLAALLSASSQPPVAENGVLESNQATVSARSQRQETTRTTQAPTQQSQRPNARIAGTGRDPRHRRNPIRQVRRLFERMGWITSGRQWRNFRKLARQDESVAQLVGLALNMSAKERSEAIRAARGRA